MAGQGIDAFGAGRDKFKDSLPVRAPAVMDYSRFVISQPHLRVSWPPSENRHMPGQIQGCLLNDLGHETYCQRLKACSAYVLLQFWDACM